MLIFELTNNLVNCGLQGGCLILSKICLQEQYLCCFVKKDNSLISSLEKGFVGLNGITHQLKVD